MVFQEILLKFRVPSGSWVENMLRFWCMSIKMCLDMCFLSINSQGFINYCCKAAARLHEKSIFQWLTLAWAKHFPVIYTLCMSSNISITCVEEETLLANAAFLCGSLYIMIGIEKIITYILLTNFLYISQRHL